MSNVHVRVSRCFLLFFFVFGLSQVMYFFTASKVNDVVNLIVNIIYVSAFAVLVKKEGLGLQEYGLYWPRNCEKHIFTGVLLAFVYFFVAVFLAGTLIGFQASSSTPSSSVPLEIIVTLLVAFAGESIFRGYIQGNLAEPYGFPLALSLSSLMFSLHRFPLPLIGSFSLVSGIDTAISLFLMATFLGFFFERTMNLMGPVTFHAVVLLLSQIMPLAAVRTEYVLLFDVIAYIFLIILLKVVVVKET